MSSRIRRALVVATTVALLMGVFGAAAPVSLARGDTSTRVAGINVDAVTIPEMQALMNRHRLSSLQLTQFYLHRIRKLNPTLHAVITVSPTALADARAADKARKRGDRRPLLGIPVLVKDNINTTGMATTAGSWSLAGSAPQDAFIIERLKAAGAIIIGKANLSEWANFRSAVSSSGWSGIGGQTNMPYVLDRNPCGSSSGSAVGVAADLAVVAVGTETDGSIVCPAGANGIVGIKPTVGLVSREGIIPISADQDTAGPMTRNVTDAAVVLGAMTGVDPADPATAAQVGHAFTNYVQFLDADALDGARIGVWREGTYDPTAVPEVTPILNTAIAAMQAQGAVIVEGANVDLTLAAELEFAALLCEFKSDLPAYFETYTGPGYPRTLQDVIDFNDDNPDLEGPWDSQLFIDAEATGGRADPDCQAMRAELTSGIQDVVDSVMSANDLDAIVALTNGPAWVTSSDPTRGDFEGTQDFALFVGSSGAAAVSGYGAITVPAGYVGPLPVGISFMGGAWSEPELIGFAYDFEQATRVRVPPQFLPTLGEDARKGRGKASSGGGQGQADRLMPLR